MNPTIRFFQGPTGQRVAYAVHGQGPPLVCSAWWVSHLEEDWSQPAFRAFFEALAEHFTVIRYDRPGAGLSDRDRERVDPADESATFTALVDHLELKRLSAFGLTCAIPPILAFAASQPERVDKLVLFGGYLRGADLAPEIVQEALTKLVQAHWGMGSKVITDLFDPGLDAAGRDAMSRAQRAAASKQMAASLLGLTFQTDSAACATQVLAPALVLHRKDDCAIPFAAGRALAAGLPNATFHPLPGNEHVPWAGDSAAALQAIVSFLVPDAVREPVASTGAYVLARAGDLWRLTFGQATVHLKHARGLDDLATLLANPNQDLHVDTLWAGGAPKEASQTTPDPILDEDARLAYRDRLRALERKLVDAHAAQEQELRDERDALVKELRSAVGLGGRNRDLDATSERARKAVTSRLRSSIQKIVEVAPAAGAHFHKTISTGTFCCYRAQDGLQWVVE